MKHIIDFVEIELFIIKETGLGISFVFDLLIYEKRRNFKSIDMHAL